MKTMCPAGYHHNGFGATHTLGYKLVDISDASHLRITFSKCANSKPHYYIK